MWHETQSVCRLLRLWLLPGVMWSTCVPVAPQVWQVLRSRRRTSDRLVFQSVGRSCLRCVLKIVGRWCSLQRPSRVAWLGQVASRHGVGAYGIGVSFGVVAEPQWFRLRLGPSVGLEEHVYSAVSFRCRFCLDWFRVQDRVDYLISCSVHLAWWLEGECFRCYVASLVLLINCLE